MKHLTFKIYLSKCPDPISPFLLSKTAEQQLLAKVVLHILPQEWSRLHKTLHLTHSCPFKFGV